MKAQTFTIPAKGVGRKDYSDAIERSVQPYITRALRQDSFEVYGVWLMPVIPFPLAWDFYLVMPQEDGTWDYLASSITLHFFELHASIKTNHLIGIGLKRYASIDDALAGIVAERSPFIFSYNKADLTFLKGIPTREGSVYAAYANAWPDPAGGDFDFTLTATGVWANLTPPYMTP